MFYYNPYLFLDYNNIDNSTEIKEMIDSSMIDSIKRMIPVRNVLREYLTPIFNNSIKKNNLKQKEIPAEKGSFLTAEDMGLNSSNNNINNNNINNNNNNNNSSGNDFSDFNEEFGASSGNKGSNDKSLDDFDSFLKTNPFSETNAEPINSNPFPESDPFSESGSNSKPSFFPASENDSVLEGILNNGGSGSEGGSGDFGDIAFKDEVDSVDSFREIGSDPVKKIQKDPFVSSSNDTDPFASSSNDIDPFASSSNDADNLFVTTDSPIGMTDDLFSPPEQKINFNDLE